MAASTTIQDINLANVRLGHEQEIDYLRDGADALVHVAVGTANADTVVTLNKNILGASGQRFCLCGVYFSYAGGTVSTGRLLIQDTTSGETLWDLDYNTASKEFVVWTPPLRCRANSTVTITLKGGGSGVIGKVNVHAYILA